MMRKKISPIDPATLEADTKSTYPDMFQKPVAGRRKRRIAPLAHLKHLSAVHVEFPPGCASSLRVWQSHEDELIIVTEGELTLVTDDGEEIMRAGHIAGFPAGSTNGHQIVNRSAHKAVFVEVASFDEQNTSTYPDHDLLLIPDGRGRRFVRKDGTPY